MPPPPVEKPNPAKDYFANKTGNELGTELVARVSEWRDFQQDSGRLGLMQDSHALAYGFDRDGGTWSSHRITQGKKNKGIRKVRNNHYGSIARSIEILVTSNNPTFEARAQNTDTDSTSQAALGSIVLEETLHGKLRPHLEALVRHAVRYSAGWMDAVFDPKAGPEVSGDLMGAEDVPRNAETLEVEGLEREGDVVFHSYTPAEVFLDPNVRDQSHREWVITRRMVNRYNLAAENPALASKILAITPDAKDTSFRLSGGWKGVGGEQRSKDMVPLFEFWHLKTSAVPEGKRVRFLAADIVLSDEPIQRDYLPVYELIPEPLDDTPHGHTHLFDLQGPQQVVDSAASNAISKSAHSLPKFGIPRKAMLEKKQLDDAFAVFEFDGEHPPKEFGSQATAEPDVALVGWAQNQMETLSGINSVVRGNPEQALKGGAGVAYAFIQAQSVLSQSKLQQNYHGVLERVGLGILKEHKAFNGTKRALKKAAGASQSYMLEAWSGADLAKVDGVSVRVGSALQQSIAGRQQVLEGMQKMGANMDPDAVFTFLTTGEWRNVAGHLQDEDQLIRQENERLSRGEEVPVAAAGEDHIKHIFGQRPKSIADKLDPNLPARLEHLASHAALLVWPMLDPVIIQKLATMGIAPPAPPPGMMQPPGKGSTSATKAPEGGDPTMAPPVGPGDLPPEADPGMPELPNGDPAATPGVIQ